jgi:hypothetical protein
LESLGWVTTSESLHLIVLLFLHFEETFPGDPLAKCGRRRERYRECVHERVVKKQGFARVSYDKSEKL